MISKTNSNKIVKLHNIQAQVKDIQSSILQLRRNEKDFILRKDMKYLDKFNKNSKTLLVVVADLKANLSASDIPLGNIGNVEKNLKEYQAAYNKLVNAWVNKGLNKTSGHYGKLRSATHNIEESITSAKDLTSQVLLLTLRRHEKDFMLRNEEKYILKLKKTAEQLEQQLNTSETKEQLKAYLNEIDSFFIISQKIGLTSKLGLQGEMRGVVHKAKLI